MVFSNLRWPMRIMVTGKLDIVRSGSAIPYTNSSSGVNIGPWTALGICTVHTMNDIIVYTGCPWVEPLTFLTTPLMRLVFRVHCRVRSIHHPNRPLALSERNDGILLTSLWWWGKVEWKTRICPSRERRTIVILTNPNPIQRANFRRRPGIVPGSWDGSW